MAELVGAVKKLSSEEFKEFRNLIADIKMDLWDKQIEEDYDAGRLDSMIAEALEEYAAGKSTEL